MKEEPEMERFDMGSDFVDGEWIDGEFYYRSRKKRRSQTKEEALYGYESSASDSEREERRRRKRRNGLIPDDKASKLMNFVSGSSQGVGSAEAPASTSKSNATPVEDDEPRLGIGASSSNNSGLGGNRNLQNGNSMHDEEPSSLFDNTPLGRKLQENVRQKPGKENKAAKKIATPWEKSSNKFGSRMLEKMGWTGAGLGKNEEGMVAPIEQTVRPKGLGLGFGSSSVTATVKPAAEEAVEPKVNERLWLKKNKNKAKEYVTAEELLKRQGDKGGRTVERVLDMTGPQVRVVTDMRDLNLEQMPPEDDTPMPELQHNLKLLVDLVASDVQHYDSKLRHEKQTVEILRKDRERLQKDLELQSQGLEVMQTIMAAINGLKLEAAARRLTLDGLAFVFRKLKGDFPEEFKAWNLATLALSHALPLVAPQFHGWEPLLQPSRGINTMVLWKEVFQEDDEPIFFEVDTSPFTRLVMETIMPYIRRAVVNWEARDPEPLLGFFEMWEKLLPPSVLHNVLDHLVMPKLSAEVDAWNPLTDTVPVHAWVHPWLLLLGPRMDSLCGVILGKLESVLGAWDPRDASAFAMLSPWHSVFDATSWEQLLLRKIVPKLKYALDLLVINPAEQKLEPFDWVMSWYSVMPVQYMIRILEERFFPKWLKVLYHWLRSTPNFNEVSRWYEGWKSVLPQELLANERIRWQLNGALELMNQAVEGVPLVMRSQEQRQQQFEAPVRLLQQQDVEEMLSLKDMVERFAEENGVMFLPKKERMHEGLQVYGFGKISISVDNHKQLILAQAGENWTSVSMEDLLQMHHAKQGGKWNN